MKKDFENIVKSILNNEILKIIISNKKNNYKYNKIILELKKASFILVSIQMIKYLI